MRDITEDEIRSAFGKKTFSRGQDYFENGYVERGIKKGDSLIGKVLGSAPQLYKVKVEIKDDIHSECTCPVRGMCKHGVALLLQWVNEKDSFVDADRLLISLGGRSKEELIKIVGIMLENDPAFASKLAFSEEVTKKRVNIEAIARRLRHIGGGFLSYYEISGVADDLEEVREIADNLREEGHLEDAVEVYLLLIEWGVDTFEAGADDSDGELGDVVIACVEDFGSIAEPLREEQKRDLLYRIIKIVEVEDYGLETEEMLYRIASKGNIALIEEELLKRIPSREGHHTDYHRRKILDLISGLYGVLGMKEDALRVMKEAGLKTSDDYARMVRELIEQDENERAFHCVREGLKLETGGDRRLGELYFMLLHQLFLEKEKDIEVNTEEMMTTALQLLSSSFDPARYSIMKDVFEKIGNYDGFVSNIKKKCDEKVVIDMLLHENCPYEAVERALTSPTLYPLKLMRIAGVAKEIGKDEAAIKLIGKAVKGGLSSADVQECELVEFFVKKSEEKELKEGIDHIRNTFITRIFVGALLKRNQEFAVMLLKKIVTDIGKEEVKSYAMRLENKYAKDVCHFWVSAYLSRSYVYYDDVLNVLKVLKKMAGEKEWKEYISALVENNRGKKKLVEKIRNQNW